MIKHYGIILLTLIAFLLMSFNTIAATPTGPPYIITLTLKNDPFAPVIPLTFDKSKSQNCESKQAGVVTCTVYKAPPPPSAVADIYLANAKKPTCSVNVTLADLGDGYAFSPVKSDYFFTFAPRLWDGHSNMNTILTISHATTPNC